MNKGQKNLEAEVHIHGDNVFVESKEQCTSLLGHFQQILETDGWGL